MRGNTEVILWGRQWWEHWDTELEQDQNNTPKDMRVTVNRPTPAKCSV